MVDVLLFDALPADLKSEISQGIARSTCPTCGGGSTRERSLDIRQTEEGVMRLKCWRSTCGWYGITVTDPNAQIQSRSMKPPRPFVDSIYKVDGKLQQKLVLDYQLDRQQWERHGWGISADGETLIMPVYDPFGNTRGHVTRTFEAPKRCFTFKTTAQAWQDWWRIDEDKPTVIVEDCLSACRLATLGLNSVALLGTSINVAQAKEIQAFGGRDLYIALDNDAFEKSLKLVERFAHIVRMKPVLLTEDIKSMEFDKDILQLFPGWA